MIRTFLFMGAVTALSIGIATCAKATGPSAGLVDPKVERFISENIVVDPNSAMTYGGVGVRFINGDPYNFSGGGGGTFETVPAIPLPPSALALGAALIALRIATRKRFK